MTRLARSLTALCLALSVGASAQPPVETYTLDDALLKSQRNNAQLQSVEQSVRIAEQRVKEARMRFLPEIGVQASATRFKSRYPFALRPAFQSLLLFPSEQQYLYSGQAYMTMSLYEGRRNINTLRLAKMALKQSKTKQDVVTLDIKLETKKVFYRLILAQEVLRAIEELIEAVGAPAASEGPWQKLEAEALAAELRSARASARHELDLARLRFLKGLNRELDTPVRVEGRLETFPVEVDLRKSLVWATELRPELQAQTYKAQMDAIGVNLALSRRTPTLRLGLDYEITGQQFPLKQNNWDATVGIRLPFALDFWTQHNKKVAEQRQGHIQRAELRDQVHLEVRTAHKELVFWQEEWPRREAEYLRLKKLFDAALRARAGSAAFRAAARMLSAKKRYMQAVAEHILSRARLERAVGRALPEPS